MYNEIGSNFWLNTESIKGGDSSVEINKIKELACDDFAFFSSGRTALGFILDSMQTKTALLPVYTCESVIQPFADRGYIIDYYDISMDLTPQINSLSAGLTRNPDVVFFHSYFGFDTLSKINRILDNTDAIIIEDITHSMFSDIPRIKADYYIGSFRKWSALPDGGFAAVSDGFFENKPAIENDCLVKLKLDAFHKKFLYMEKGSGDKQDFLEAYRLAEETLDSCKHAYAMSSISMRLFNTLDKNEISMRRRNNYNVLFDFAARCRKIKPVLGELKAGVIPLYFPIYCQNREELQKYLQKQRVYAPVIWPVPAYIKDNRGMEIYKNILSIPCDQRYTERDMQKIGALLLEAEAEYAVS